MQFVPVLSDEQLHTAQAMSHELWSGGMSLEARVQLIKSLRERFPKAFQYRGLIDDSGSLIASLKEYSAEIEIQGLRQHCLGIGAVFTDPAWRGRGFAAALIRQCIEIGKERRLDGAILWSDIGVEYYERLGFTAFRQMRQTYGIDDIHHAVHYRKASSTDRKYMIDLFHASIRGLELSTVRSLELWNFYRELNHANDHIVLDEQQTRPVGFFSAAKYQDYLWVDEACSEKGRGLAVWQAISLLAQEQKAERICSWLQPFGVLPTPQDAHPVTKAIPMLQLFHQPMPPMTDLYRRYWGSLDHF